MGVTVCQIHLTNRLIITDGLEHSGPTSSWWKPAVTNFLHIIRKQALHAFVFCFVFSGVTRQYAFSFNACVSTAEEDVWRVADQSSHNGVYFLNIKLPELTVTFRNTQTIQSLSLGFLCVQSKTLPIDIQPLLSDLPSLHQGQLYSFHTSAIDSIQLFFAALQLFFGVGNSASGKRIWVDPFRPPLDAFGLLPLVCNQDSMLRVRVSNQLPHFSLISSGFSWTRRCSWWMCILSCWSRRPNVWLQWIWQSVLRVYLSLLQQHKLWLHNAKAQPRFGGLQDDPGE